MPDRIADKDYYANADGKLVSEADAHIVVARKGTAISEDTAQRYGIKGGTEAPVYDAVADHEAKHGGETDADAEAKRARMFDPTKPGDPDGPPVAGERGDLDTKATDAPPDTKAVSRAPANKGA